MTYLSHADLGGQDGQGAIRLDPAGPLFHAAWEPRVLALTLAMGATGLWNIDMSRAARETLDGYSGFSYYRIWLAGLEKLLIQQGAAQAEEIGQGRMLRPGVSTAKVLPAGEVAGLLARGAPTARRPSTAARFAIGQSVRTNAVAPGHHTRLPGYARGRRGIVERVHGAHVFADTNSLGLGEQPQWLYTVGFEAQELWGANAPCPRSTVSVDAWEPYLEAV